ncbi:hypothetical protein PR001_g33531 [Phytophthora rubi]|uniref:Uncharacterized protein n=1 Tax=Phytophthora rubi TaxID=129364 RepID=A0A6A3G4F9_9STRA|nr:hypothetical protein PR001_g33531 [Phytophthora rubi]
MRAGSSLHYSDQAAHFNLRLLSVVSYVCKSKAHASPLWLPLRPGSWRTGRRAGSAYRAFFSRRQCWHLLFFKVRASGPSCR